MTSHTSSTIVDSTRNPTDPDAYASEREPTSGRPPRRRRHQRDSSRRRTHGEDTRAANEIDSACRASGFFYVSGHGVNPGLIARLDRGVRAFFAPARGRQARDRDGPRRAGQPAIHLRDRTTRALSTPVRRTRPPITSAHWPGTLPAPRRIAPARTITPEGGSTPHRCPVPSCATSTTCSIGRPTAVPLDATPGPQRERERTPVVPALLRPGLHRGGRSHRCPGRAATDGSAGIRRWDCQNLRFLPASTVNISCERWAKCFRS
ncbi:2-oxoglutarate and iron-dependent oxygenase domain-containing protein [Dactylosporangium sp. NPDC000555]|uniref:2-oxoglutarate and iron-dependent oxygenase domain-containing protein n=1 Tax=Dactylosporangium sp. NPDC000555 TaxID=3154260 RepID=UPI00331EA4B8